MSLYVLNLICKFNREYITYIVMHLIIINLRLLSSMREDQCNLNLDRYEL